MPQKDNIIFLVETYKQKGFCIQMNVTPCIETQTEKKKTVIQFNQ